MIRIISGKRYNTETAIRLCGYENNSIGPWFHERTSLYVTEKGAFFLAGEGGKGSRWRRSDLYGNVRSGKGIIVLTKTAAAVYAELWGMEKEKYAKYFDLEDA